MAITLVPDLPVLGSAPSTTDMANFDTRADAFLPGLKPWGDIVKAIGDATKANAEQANSDAKTALAAKQAAEAAAAAAAGASGASKWTAATAYSEGVVAWSPTDFRSYRRKAAGTTPTDPSSDAANWAPLGGAVRPRILVDSAAQNALQGVDYVIVFAGAVTLTAPAAPAWGGESIGVIVANGRTDNAVAFNGSKHQGIADAQMSIDDPFASFQLVPLNATYGWSIA